MSTAEDKVAADKAAADKVAADKTAADKAAAKAAKPVKAPKGPAITVVGPKEGFRRAGRAFGAEPVTIPLDELSKDEIKAIQTEPRLVSTIVGGDA